MALELRLNKLDEFYEMTDFARKPHYNQLHIRCSPESFTLAVSRPSPQGRCFIELQLLERFFPRYVLGTDRTLHRAISPQHFFATFLRMKQSGYDFTIFTLAHNLLSLQLSFRNISDDPRDLPCDVYFPFLSTHQNLDLDRADSTTFTIFPSFRLRSILELLNDSHVTLAVTLTTSQVKFTPIDLERRMEFVLPLDKSCVIGGVLEGEETEFVIVLNPLESFNNILARSNSTDFVGIGKSKNNNNRGVISITMGFNAQYAYYSSDQ